MNSNRVETIEIQGVEKLNLERFRAEGIDYDLRNPKKRYRQLIADLRYLGNSAFPRLKAGLKWGDWKLKDVLKYFAKIVDTLRGIYFPILERKDSSSYWQCYWESKRYMKTKPPKTPEELKEWNERRKEWQEKIEKTVQPFGTPGGKAHLKDEIIPFIPEHKIYVEPFAGGAAVFFKKKKAERNILNDKDPEISFALRYLRDNEPEKIRKVINGYNWILSKKRWKESFEKTKDKDLRFCRFLYCLRGSFSRNRKDFKPSFQGKSIKPKLKNLEKIHEKLQGVKILNRDALDLIKEADSKETFFYLDPPYLEDWARDESIDWKEFSEILRNLKGNFILSTNEEGLKFFKDFPRKSVLRFTTFQRPNSRGRGTYYKEYLVSNLPFLKRNLYVEKILVPSDIPTLLESGVRILEIENEKERKKPKSRLRKILDTLREKSMITPSDIPELMKPGRVILQPAKILVKPHGDWAISGKKKAIVTARRYEKYVERPVYLIQGNYCLGVIELSKPVKISLEAFRKLRKYHLVSEKERKKWWPRTKSFYFYKIFIIQRFRPPKEIIRPRGAQTWLEAVTFKNLDLKPVSPSVLTDEELMKVKEFLHENYENGIPNWSKEDILNYFILLIREMRERGIEIEEKGDKLEEDSREMLETLTKSETLVLKFLGTKGWIEEENENHKFHSSLLLTLGDKRLLIDWGKINQGNLEKFKPTYIINTHAHPDHIGGLNDMEVYVSEDTSKALPNLYKDFNIVEHVYSSYETFNLGPFRITAIPVYHSIKAPTHIFLIEVKSFRFLYTPDILSWRKGVEKGI